MPSHPKAADQVSNAEALAERPLPPRAESRSGSRTRREVDQSKGAAEAGDEVLVSERVRQAYLGL
jgi:hypothetical protein